MSTLSFLELCLRICVFAPPELCPTHALTELRQGEELGLCVFCVWRMAPAACLSFSFGVTVEACR